MHKKNRGGLFGKKIKERYFSFKCKEKELHYAHKEGGKTKVIPLVGIKATAGDSKKDKFWIKLSGDKKKEQNRELACPTEDERKKMDPRN